MPELPEVESLRRYLVAGQVPGRVITSATADWPGVENTVDGVAGLSTLPGRRIMLRQDVTENNCSCHWTAASSAYTWA